MSIKTLVVYYSFEGNTQLVAETIAKILGADLLKLQPEKEIGTKGFMKYFWGGRQAVMKHKPKLLPIDKNPNDYDLLIIGTPVWAFTFTPPLRTLFEEHPVQGKKIALFITHEGVPGKIFMHLQKLLSNNKICAELEILSPLKKDQENKSQKIVAWANALKDKL